tara:strand:- start:3274 stop:3759 length:486 start_codon:yes stop_codon:yes gene_type:complete
MKISQLLAEKNGFHWIELDNNISFLANTIENGKFFSVLNEIKNLDIIFSDEEIYWFDQGIYEKHKNCVVTSIGELDEKFQNWIKAEIIAENILLDWHGITDEKSEKIPYNKEIAKTIIFENRRIRNFFTFSAYHLNLEPKEQTKISELILDYSKKYFDFTY